MDIPVRKQISPCDAIKLRPPWVRELVIKPAKRTHTCRKEGLVPPLHPGDLVSYEKTSKIMGNAKALVFPAESVEYSEVLRSEKGARWAEREKKVRKAKSCRRLQGGCLQAVDVCPTGGYPEKVEADQKKPDEEKKKLQKASIKHRCCLR